MQNSKEIDGITLIILVITIVVLLILIGVSFTVMMGQNGIIEKINEAKRITDEKNSLERVQAEIMGSYGTDGKIDNELLKQNLKNISNIREIPKNITDELYPFNIIVNDVIIEINKVNGKVLAYLIEEINRFGIAVGDYIDYKPDISNYYSKDNLAFLKSGSNLNSLEDIKQDTLVWQILKINKDGSMDLIGSPTSQAIYLSGAIGYNNGVYILNDICEKLYSKDSIKARSIKMEDIEYWLTSNGQEIKKSYISSSGKKIGETQKFESGSSYYPDLYSKENGSGINSDTIKIDGIEMSDKTCSDFTIPTNKTYSNANINGLTVKQTFWYSGRNSINNTNFGKGSKSLYSSTNSYWIASRFVDCYTNRAIFGLRCADTAYSGIQMLFSNAYTLEYQNIFKLRPVVSIDANVKIVASKEASTNSEKPHKIIEY